MVILSPAELKTFGENLVDYTFKNIEKCEKLTNYSYKVEINGEEVEVHETYHAIIVYVNGVKLPYISMDMRWFPHVISKLTSFNKDYTATDANQERDLVLGLFK